MATVIYVHGTGVRQQGYVTSKAIIEKHLVEAKALQGRTIKVEDCLWGDSYGSRPASLSVPEYRRTGGVVTGLPQDEDEVLRWEMLGYNSLYELSGLALQPPPSGISFRPDLGPFRASVQRLPSGELERRLRAAGLDATFPAARDYVLGSEEFTRALGRSSAPAQHRMAVARAIVAEAMDRAPAEPSPAASVDPSLRDDLVGLMADEIAGPVMAPPLQWLSNQLFRVAQRMGAMNLVRRRRGSLADFAGPLFGDVLLYQAKGQGIRNFIRHQVELARDHPPVVLLAHSLGGIACVDLLAAGGDKPLQVELLVTVGSQAPFLYEINALSSLDRNDPLPESFPRRWVNVYDPRDFLGFRAEGVFAQDERSRTIVKDYVVDNELAFPDAHGGYWSNPDFWDAVSGEIALL